MELRDYQARVVDFLIQKEKGFAIAPAGSGKTVMAAVAVSRVVRPFQKVGWLANTRDQVDQGIAAIQSVGGPQDVEFDFWCVAAQPNLSQLDVVVWDECHHLPAESWLGLFAMLKKQARIFGFSATPWATAERDAVLLQCFGGRENFIEIGMDEVRGSGHLAEGSVIFHDLDQPAQFDAEIQAKAAPEIRRRCAFMRNIIMPPHATWSVEEEHRRRVTWQVTQDFVQQNRARNAAAVFIALEAAEKGISVLVLVSSIEHGEQIAEAIGPHARMVHSKAKGRRGLIASYRKGEYRVMVGTSLCDEGLDCPIAAVLVLLSGGRSPTKIIQRAGRVMRPYPGKTHGIVHDFLDRGAGLAYNQARSRKKTYLSLGYDVQVSTP
jgi:superfamily II DNA or RNA helicase